MDLFHVLGIIVTFAGMALSVGIVVNTTMHRMQEYRLDRVYFGDIWWDVQWNTRKNYGTLAELANLVTLFMRRPGWSTQNEPIIERLTETELIQVVRPSMTKKWKELQNANEAIGAKREAQLRLTHFENLYTHVVNGVQVIKDPKWRGDTGNRRASQWIEYHIQHQLHNEKYVIGQEEGLESKQLGKLDPINDMIPVKIPMTNGRFVDSQGDENSQEAEEIRLEEINRENIEKKEGAKDYDAAEYLGIAQMHVVKFGRNQNYIRKNIGVKDSRGVQLYWIVKLNQRFPELNIIAHCTSTPYDGTTAPNPNYNDPLHIELNRCEMIDLQEFGLRMQDKAELDETNQRRANSNPVKSHLDPITKDSVREYFFGLNGNPPGYLGKKPPQTKAMSKDVMTNRRDATPIQIVKDTITAVRDAKSEAIPTEMSLALPMNLLYQKDFPPFQLPGVYTILQHIYAGGITADEICSKFDLLPISEETKEEVERPTNAGVVDAGVTETNGTTEPSVPKVEDTEAEGSTVTEEPEENLDADFAGAPSPSSKGKSGKSGKKH